MHASVFSYNISRPYPFRWFTPAVVVGGVIAAILIAFWSVATQGYELISISSSNPNATDTHQTFFGKWASIFSTSTKSFCSSTNLFIGTQFYTNNTALSYTLTNIKENGKDGNLLGSLPYYNNPINNCTVNQVSITFESIERNALQIARQHWGAVLGAQIDCIIDTSQGSKWMQLSTNYDFNNPDPVSVSTLAEFPSLNESSALSLWWGSTLLQWYSAAATDAAYKAIQNSSDAGKPVYKGYTTFTRGNISSIPTADEIESEDFFIGSGYFVSFSPNSSESIYFTHQSDLGNSGSIQNLTNSSNPDTVLPGIWLPADDLAKAFYFTVLADLGQASSGPNILADPDLLAYFSKKITGIQNGTVVEGDNLLVQLMSGPKFQPFQPRDASASRLGISPSVISISYLCQVPHLKSTSSLLISVITNGFVILSALWKLFKLIIDYILVRKYPDLRFCERCSVGMMPAEEKNKDPMSTDAGNSSDTETLLHAEPMSQGAYHHMRQTES